MMKNKIMSLPCIYIFETLKFVKKHYIEFYEQLEIKHSYNTRGTQNKILTAPSTHLTQIQKNVQNQSVKIYNHLPYIIKQLPYILFTREVSENLKNHCYYSIEEYFESSF
uniref:Uncharacterized protein n=1 Tax=Cacopsylla melanoneura TaxID=428564 RepID=A0A8D8YV88_9HEMI